MFDPVLVILERIVGNEFATGKFVFVFVFVFTQPAPTAVVTGISV